MKTRILFLTALAVSFAPGFGDAVAGPAAPATYPGRLALVQHQDGALVSNPNPAVHDIWVWDFAAAPVNASHDRNVPSADPAWFPDGKTLAWSGGGNVYVGGSDGTGIRNLTLLFFSAYFVSPAPSPDGKALAFTDTNGETLYRAPVPAGYLTNFDLVSLGVGSGATWTPDGTRIVATRWANRAVGEIDAIDATTAARTTLRPTVGFADRTGDVSPDGRKLLFVSDLAGTDDVWVVDLDTSGAFLPATAKNLTATAGANETDPCWSPDGRFVAFVDATAAQLRIMNADGTNVVSFPQLGSVYGVDWGGSAAAAPAPPPDTTPPSIGLTVGTDSLWPPNHQLVAVGIGISVADDTDGDPTVSVTVESDEPDDAKGGGDGDTTGDAEIVLASGVVATSPGHESVTVVMKASDLDDALKGLLLRAERNGKGSGRTYTITVVATDAAGNGATATATVAVAHDRKKK